MLCLSGFELYSRKVPLIVCNMMNMIAHVSRLKEVTLRVGLKTVRLLLGKTGEVLS